MKMVKMMNKVKGIYRSFDWRGQLGAQLKK